MHKFFILMTICVGLAGCMDEAAVGTTRSGAEGPPTVDLTKTAWSFGGGRFSSSETERFEYIYTVVNIDGMAALCGVQSKQATQTARLVGRVMSDRQLYVNGKKMFQGFRHFTRVKWGVEMRRQPATCKVSTIPWNEAYGNPKNWEEKRRGNGSYLVG